MHCTKCLSLDYVQGQCVLVKVVAVGTLSSLLERRAPFIYYFVSCELV